MPTVIDNTWFKYDLAIPNAIPMPSIVGDTVNNADGINDFIAAAEESLLLNALGLTIYNGLKNALDDIENADQKWKDLVNGLEYDGKVWEGLRSPKSLIAYYVYSEYLNQNSSFFTTHGVEKPRSENSENVTPFYKIAGSWQTFVKKYQGNAHNLPYRYMKDGVCVVDYIGEHTDVKVSLFNYLLDKKDVYGWETTMFKIYEQKNSFGL